MKIDRLQINTDGTFHEKIKKMNVLNLPKFDNYVLTDTDFIVASSSQTHLIGKNFEIPMKIKNQVKKPPYRTTHIPFKKPQTSSSLPNKNILFASALGDRERVGFLFLFVSPEKNLEQIVSHSVFQASETYMVNSQGEFVTKVQWVDDLVEKGWLKSEWDSMVGFRVSENQMDLKAPLTYSASQVIHDSNSDMESYNNYLGLPVLGLWHWNNEYKFGLISEVSKSERYNIRRFHKFQTLFGFTVTSILIVLLTGFFITNRIRVAKINTKLNKSYKIIKDQNDQLAQDMFLGQKVQMDMLPYKIMDDRFKLDAYLKPAQIVSGDFYDFAFIDDKKKMYFCIGGRCRKRSGSGSFYVHSQGLHT